MPPPKRTCGCEKMDPNNWEVKEAGSASCRPENRGKKYLRCRACARFVSGGFLPDPAPPTQSPDLNHPFPAPPTLSAVPIEEHEVLSHRLLRIPRAPGDLSLVLPYYASMTKLRSPLDEREYGLWYDGHGLPHRKHFRQNHAEETAASPPTKRRKTFEPQEEEEGTLCPAVVKPFCVPSAGPSDLITRHDVVTRMGLSLFAETFTSSRDDGPLSLWVTSEYDKVERHCHLHVSLSQLPGFSTEQPLAVELLQHTSAQVIEKPSAHLPRNLITFRCDRPTVLVELHGHLADDEGPFAASLIPTLSPYQSPLILFECENDCFSLVWRRDVIRALDSFRRMPEHHLPLCLMLPSTWQPPVGRLQSDWQAVAVTLSQLTVTPILEFNPKSAVFERLISLIQ